MSCGSGHGSWPPTSGARAWPARPRSARAAPRYPACCRRPARPGESAGGISPPAARRTGLEPLGSSGSRRPAIRTCAESPVREQAGRSVGDLGQPCHRTPFPALEPFIFPASPPHQVPVEPPEEAEQLGLVEAPVIVDPPLHDAVEHLRKVVQGFVTALGPVPGADLRSHGLDRVLADRREEAHEMLPVLALGQPGTKRVPQERERRDLMIAAPVVVLAVNDARLVWMQFQAQ